MVPHTPNAIPSAGHGNETSGNLLPSSKFCKDNEARIKKFEDDGSKPQDVEGTKIFAECNMKKHIGGVHRKRSMLAILQEEAVINLEEMTELADAELAAADQVTFRADA